MSTLRIGFVPLARPTFDLALAQAITSQARALLDNAGFELVSGDELVISLDAARKVVQSLRAETLDLLLVFQSTFADSTMVMALAEAVNTPLLLWAVPEAPTGERLRLNSLCGINLGAHALKRAGHYYDTLYRAASDETALQKIEAVAKAGRVRRRLRGTRIGRVGEHPEGFDTCRVNYAGLRHHFGVNIVQYDLPTIFEKARVAELDAVDAVEMQLRPQLEGFDEVDYTALRGTLATYVTLRDLARQEKLDGYAVRCWADFFTDLGCAACGAASLLNDELTPASCETDVNGTVTQLILQWLSDEPAFGSDIVSFDMDANTGVFWHCGKAPLAMCDPDVRPRAANHSNRHLPLLMEFPLRPGRVTLARLSEATGDYRLVIGSGEVIKAPISFTGTSGVIRFDRPARLVLDTLLGEGLEHHLALTYGDQVEALLALAKMLDLPVLRL